MSHNHIEKEPACTQRKYLINKADLPLSCPTKDMEIWNAHPKIYLPIEKTGKEMCPYCGTEFELLTED